MRVRVCQTYIMSIPISSSSIEGISRQNLSAKKNQLVRDYSYNNKALSFFFNESTYRYSTKKHHLEQKSHNVTREKINY